MLQKNGRLTVKDVAEILDTEPYVLRFYEKELNLKIKRNNKGHRIYGEEDIEVLKKIQDMREQGLQLKAIETIVHNGSDQVVETYEQLSSIKENVCTDITTHKKNDIDITDMSDDNISQFSGMMKDVFLQALVEYGDNSKWELQESIKKEVDEVVEQKISEIKSSTDSKSEEYYKKLDETMREVQKIRKELSQDKGENKKLKISLWKKIFGDKNQEVSI